MPQIPKQAITSYLKNGYGVIPNFLSPSTCQAAISEIAKIINDFNPKPEEVVMFNTKHDQFKSKDYYLTSGDQVRCFLEEGSYGDGKFLVPKELAVSKIGHALHQKNKFFKSITYNPLIKQICNACSLTQPIVVQSMTINKPSGNDVKVVSHQDSTFLYDEPPSLLGFWIPFVDATQQNGCLWGLPGSHNGPLYLRARMDWGKKVSVLEKLCEVDYREEDFVPIEMEKGSLAFFSGRFVHKSQANLSASPRYAYTWHIKEKRNKWPSETWMQRQFPEIQFNQTAKL